MKFNDHHTNIKEDEEKWGYSVTLKPGCTAPDPSNEVSLRVDFRGLAETESTTLDIKISISGTIWGLFRRL